jgi:hypothetical protein
MKYRNTKDKEFHEEQTCFYESILFDYIDEGKHFLILPKTDQQQPNMNR